MSAHAISYREPEAACAAAPRALRRAVSGRVRVLIVSGDEAVHRDLPRALTSTTIEEPRAATGGHTRALSGSVLDEPPLTYELRRDHLGLDAVRGATEARAAGRPFALAFVDLVLPPALDGLETIAQLWAVQPDLEVVLCSAFSDYSWRDVARRLAPRDRLLVLRKPCDAVEASQLAACLAGKWYRGRVIQERLAELERRMRHEVEAQARERAQHDEARWRSQRLEALGQLAGRLAHEINTPTQFASSSLEYLAEIVPLLGEALAEQRRCLDAVVRGELSPAQARARVSELAYDDALAEAPRAIADATTGIARISRIVQSVRSHAHLRDRAGLVPVDVNEQVRAALDLARSEYQDEADVVVDLADVPRVLGDPGDLCLAMVSLLTNAAYAMRDRRHDSGERGLLTVSTRAEGASVEIEIRDTGTGIAREIRERVFEPFFTTKPIGQGTGQGLPIARATIVERHRGTLRFDTEVGRGTAFVIGLPVLGDGTEAIEDPVAPVARGPG